MKVKLTESSRATETLPRSLSDLGGFKAKVSFEYEFHDATSKDVFEFLETITDKLGEELSKAKWKSR